MNTVEKIASAYRPTPEARPTASVHEHHHRVLRVVDLRAIANQVRGADDAERARQAGADDQHDHRADDGEDDLGLDHRRSRGGVPRRLGRSASAAPSSAASGSRISAA